MPNTSSVYADEGTLAHEISELYLKHQLGRLSTRDFKRLLEGKKKHKLFDVSMISYVESYVDTVMEAYNYHKKQFEFSEIDLEQRVDFSKYVPEGFGTSDVVIIGKKSVSVIDLKYGKGVRVSAVDNSQLKLYAIGALLKYELYTDIDFVEVTIVQPRLDHLSSATYSVPELLNWAESVRVKADLAIQGKGDFVPGSWCQFCKIAHTCPGMHTLANQLAKEAFELEDSELDDLDNENILEMYHKLSIIDGFSKRIKSHVFNKAISGYKWQGLKIVEGRSMRKIKNEDDFKIHILNTVELKDSDITKSSLLPITYLEGLIGKKRFAELSNGYVYKPQGKPSLVPDDDKRPEISIASLDFQDFEDDIEED